MTNQEIDKTAKIVMITWQDRLRVLSVLGALLYADLRFEHFGAAVLGLLLTSGMTAVVLVWIDEARGR